MVGADIQVSDNGDLNFIRAAIGELENAKVYVGIPEAETSRKGEVVTNAGLMYIHTHGSPKRHIPARPVIEPSIEANHEILEELLHDAATAYLDGDKEQGKTGFERAGIEGANGAKRWFTDPRNGWKQNAPSTIRRKLAKLTGKRLRKALQVLDSVNAYMPLTGTTALDSINTPLIDTGELRRSITYVTEV